MTRKRPPIPKPNRFEIRSSAISISISFDPKRLAPLLMGVSACDEMRRKMKRRGSGQIVRLFETVVHGEVNERYDRQDIEYEIRVQDGDVPLEYVPLREWTQLARRLRLYVGTDDAHLKREANKAISYIRENAPDKLVRCLRQFLFEALYAATGKPVTEEIRKELEEIGTMVDRTQELRAAGKYRPADLRNWETSDLKQILFLAIRVVGRKQSITYESVAAYLQREFEFVPILTGESLRKAISHHRLNWKEMKNRKTR